jgi:amphi-Trp domain-containing protein
MKYQDKYVGTQEEIYDLLKDLPKKFMQNSVVVESERVSIPADKELTFKLKFEEDEYDGALAVKVSWVNAEEPEEEEEEEPEEEEEE